MKYAPLKIPPRIFSGFAGGVFAQGNFDWSGKLPRSTQAPLLPLAWTPFIQSFAAGQTEAAWIASHVFVNPPNWFGVRNFCVKLPRIVLIDIGAFPGINMASILAPLTQLLFDNKIMVALTSTAYNNNFDTVWRQWLPHEGLFGVSHNFPGVGNISQTIPVVVPANWKGGQVLYLDCLTTAVQVVGGRFCVFAPGSVSCPSLGPTAFEEMAETHAFASPQMANSFPRYEKFGYHIVFAMQSDYPALLTWASSGLRALQRNIVPFVVNQVGAARGATVDIFDEAWPANEVNIETVFRNKIISFFGL